MSDFLWCEQYRPRKIDDCILPENIKSVLNKFVEKGEIPNLLLSGPPGIGKTTVAKALCEQLEADYYVINGSDEGRFLDTVRNNAKNFASTVSLTATAKHKVIIIDEADNTTLMFNSSYGQALRSLVATADSSSPATTKTKSSRPSILVAQLLTSPSQERKATTRSRVFKRVQSILDENKVDAEPRILAALVQKYFPDFRRTLNELQRYSSIGKIDNGVLAAVSDTKLDDLVKFLKEKEFTKMKKWVVQNLDNEPTQIIRNVYDSLYTYLSPQSIPEAVLLIGEYQYKAAFVADQEINLVAFLTELMMRCQFK